MKIDQAIQHYNQKIVNFLFSKLVRFDVFVVIFFIILVYNYFFSKDLVLVNQGYGWDGALYPPYLENFLDLLKSKSIPPYYFQRIFLTFCIFIGCEFFNFQPKTPTDFIIVWKIANFILSIAAIFVFHYLARYLQWDKYKKAICFVLLFAIFPFLKFLPYYPILTDITAFFLGLCAVYCWYTEKNILFLIVYFASIFTFPASIIYGLLFVFKPKSNDLFFSIKRSGYSFSLLLSFLILIIWYFILERSLINIPNATEGITMVRIAYLDNFTDFSNALYFAFLFFAFSYFTLSFQFLNILKIIGQINWLNVLAIAVVILISKYIISKFTIGDSHYGILALMNEKWLQSHQYPLGNLMNLFIQYGVTPLILILNIEKLFLYIQKNGLGFLLICFAVFVLSIGTEARHIINFYPIFFVGIMHKLDIFALFSKLQWLIILVLQIILTRFWYQITPDSLDYQEFWAKYMQFQGPWTNEHFYVRNILLFFLIFVMLLYFKKSRVGVPAIKS